MMMIDRPKKRLIFLNRLTDWRISLGLSPAMGSSSISSWGPVARAVDWFNGLDIPPIRYLPMRVIAHSDVDSYFPAQW